MSKDKRYNVVRAFIKSRKIKTFAQIFDYIPKSVVSIEIRTNNNRFTRLINDPTDFKLKELSKIAKAIGIDKKILVHMAFLSEDAKKSKPNKGIKNK